MNKSMKRTNHIGIFALLALLLIGVVAVVLYLTVMSNPHNYKTIGEIPPPDGYERVEGNDYAEYLRSLPLRGRGAEVQFYTGEKRFFDMLNYAVVDIPLLSNAEQCADACMRLRAEYLFQKGLYDSIHFDAVSGKTMKYEGGHDRKAFEQYLRDVYDVANTFSLSRELKQRALKDLQPGDIFIYSAEDRNGAAYGHAVTVVDVAQNRESGQKAFLLAQGFLPARSIHVMRNLENLFQSPWFILEEDAETLTLSTFSFRADELRHFE